jgi:hypothetical protein
MGRDENRELLFCVPTDGTEADEEGETPRLEAPRSLLSTAEAQGMAVSFEALPQGDVDGNPRTWHAKMIWLQGTAYSGLMIGSSNFTSAGLGVGGFRNAEANLLTILNYAASGKEQKELEAVWPEMSPIPDPDGAEWLGAHPESTEDGPADRPQVPDGFIGVTYYAGPVRRLVLQLNPTRLPVDWRVYSSGRETLEIFSTAGWEDAGRPAILEAVWGPEYPPERLLLRWEGKEAFLPINIADRNSLPPPPELNEMSADDLLMVLGTSDPGAVFRVLARRAKSASADDDLLDSATPIDLDPLRRFDLRATFLHRIRRRATILAQMRANLERPVFSARTLDWRLNGLIGVRALADKYLREFTSATKQQEEALLVLADLLIVLTEVNYLPADGSITKAAFMGQYRPFLRGLAESLNQNVRIRDQALSRNALAFWGRVVALCQE